MKMIYVSSKFIQRKTDTHTHTHTKRFKKWKGSCEKQKLKCIGVQNWTDKKVW